MTANTTNPTVPDRLFIMPAGLTPHALIGKHKIHGFSLAGFD